MINKSKVTATGIFIIMLIIGQALASEVAKENKKDPVATAQEMISKGNLVEAEKILQDFVSKMPSDWKPLQETETNIVGYFWDQDEFMGYVKYYEKSLKKSVRWIGPSYSKAFFRLAFISVERKDFQSALAFIDKALTLEPDNPGLLCEKAFILSRMGQYQEAYQIYLKATKARPWISDLQKAATLRGTGNVLIDLKKLDEAEEMLNKSLELEPGNKNAQNELGYIDHLRKGKTT